MCSAQYEHFLFIVYNIRKIGFKGDLYAKHFRRIIFWQYPFVFRVSQADAGIEGFLLPLGVVRLTEQVVGSHI